MSAFAVVQRSAAAGILAFLLSTTIPGPTAAQEPRTITVGDLVRVEERPDSNERIGPRIGRFLGANADTVWISSPRRVNTGQFRDSINPIQRARVQRFEVSIGHRHAKTGAIVGGIVAAAAGAMLSIGWDLHCTYCRVSASEAILPAALSSAPGAGLGALLGLAIPGPGPWVPARTRPEPAPM